ncbi:MAG: hypothetical protein ABIN91_14660 [Mucilaginibacter sp.]|uniref:hypothetical protein n=1 Tax=Mucilaginibacter sp. TaxID=1882438 RepID=UPI0032636CB9
MNPYTPGVAVKNALYIIVFLLSYSTSSARDNLSYVDPTIGGVGLIPRTYTPYSTAISFG